MNTKNKILELLEKNKGRNLSGEEIAVQMGISRSAVWKVIKSLEQDGYDIKAGRNKGYSLSDNCDILSVQGFMPFLHLTDKADNIFIYDTLESTNKTAKEMAVNGSIHGTVIIADTQTAGKGRYGRSFFSPPKSGLYISFILRPELLGLSSVTLITSAVAVAVCRVIKAVSGKDASIKWVNDILLDDKKICGILTEAITDFESGGIGWIVVGIGININTDDFPGEIKQTATSIFSEKSNTSIRNKLAAELINIILSEDKWLNEEETYAEYKNRLSLLGRTVTVFHANQTYEAIALDIDETCRLIVKKEDGTIVHLSSGEVSVRARN